MGEVPDGIKALVDLRFLSLNNNPLKTLCYGIGALTRLVDLVRRAHARAHTHTRTHTHTHTHTHRRVIRVTLLQVLDGLPDLETPPRDIRIKGPQQVVK